MSSFLTNYNITAEIGVALTGSTWTYATLGAGIDNVSEALNEVVQQYQFLNGQGFAENHVTGAAPAWTLSGKRILGDTAQDYIAGLKYEFDDARKSSLKISYVKGDVAYSIKVPVTICNIVAIGGGASTDDSVFSCEIRFDGKPHFRDPVSGIEMVIGASSSTSAGWVLGCTGTNPVADKDYYRITVAGSPLPFLQSSEADLTGWTLGLPSATTNSFSIPYSNYAVGKELQVVTCSPAGNVIKGGSIILTLL